MEQYTDKELKSKLKADLFSILDDLKFEGIFIPDSFPNNPTKKDLIATILHFQKELLYTKNERAVFKIFHKLFKRDPNNAEIGVYADALRQGMSVPNVESVLKRSKEYKKNKKYEYNI
jgi:hypothetical protein